MAVMIAALTGTIQYLTPQYTVIMAGNVGYKVYIAQNTYHTLREGHEATLLTHLIVREQALDLYGFIDQSDKDFFELLLTVSGVGPKLAITILSIADTASLKRSIAHGDTDHLTSVSGIGKKVASKIVAELKDHIAIQVETDGVGTQYETDRDALQALVSLGYKEREVREALRSLPETITEIQTRITEALKILGK